MLPSQSVIIVHGFSRLWGASSEHHEVTPDETINVFSLASGHLYERFLKIMILSVIKHTNNPVKFWFLANFLSPKFMVQSSCLLRAIFFLKKCDFFCAR